MARNKVQRKPKMIPFETYDVTKYEGVKPAPPSQTRTDVCGYE